MNRRNRKPPKILTRSEVAAFLKVSLSTIRRLEKNGTGPKYALVGRAVRYRLIDVHKWLEEQSNAQPS